MTKRKHIVALPALVALLAGSAVGVTAQSPAPEHGDLVTEEVEPGVVRIVNDGAGHDLDERHPSMRYDMDGITVGADGTVWLVSTYSGSDNDVAGHDGQLLWALGRPGMHNVPVPEGTLVGLADGSLLAIGDRVTRFDGQAFRPDDGPKQRPLGDDAWLWIIEPDELMALVEEGESVERPGVPLAVIWDGGFMSVSEFGRRARFLHAVCSAGQYGVTCRDWEGYESRYLEGTAINQVAGAPDGAIWAVGGYDGENGGLYRITPE